MLSVLQCCGLFRTASDSQGVQNWLLKVFGYFEACSNYLDEHDFETYIATCFKNVMHQYINADYPHTLADP